MPLVMVEARVGCTGRHARVLTDEQNLALQVDALRNHGCTRACSATSVPVSLKNRPQLDAALDYLRPGQDDVLVGWRLDRLGRGLRHLIDLVEQLSW